jgi:hypothetical protein
MKVKFSVLLCALILVVSAPSASAVSFGFSEPGGCATWTNELCTTWSAGLGHDAPQPLFQTLKTRLPFRYARFAVPYNLLADYDRQAHRCRPDRQFTSPTTDAHGDEVAAQEWNLLRSELVVAHAQGLQVLIGITDGRVVRGPGADEMWPIPIYWDGKRYRPTNAGMDYTCAVRALISRVAAEQRSIGAPPAEWEAFDEPDARASYNGALHGACRGPRSSCGGSYGTLCGPQVGGECGPLEAAALYTSFVTQLRAMHVGGKVAAGTFSKAGPYADGYMNQLIGTLHARPAVVSFHDYIDPTANSTAIAHAFAMDLYQKFGKRFELWITESGVYLGEYAPLPPDGGSSTVHGCEFGTLHAPGVIGLGRCINGNARAQQAGATDFKYHLAQQGSYRGVRITQLFWYQFQALPPTKARPVQWDSGLLDAQGVPRVSYCVLVGKTGCTGNPRRNR